MQGQGRPTALPVKVSSERSPEGSRCDEHTCGAEERNAHEESRGEKKERVHGGCERKLSGEAGIHHSALSDSRIKRTQPRWGAITDFETEENL